MDIVGILNERTNEALVISMLLSQLYYSTSAD